MALDSDVPPARSHSHPVIMGILNTTPDSFYDGGEYDRVETAVRRGLEMESKGADVIDVGGESTRPGAQNVPIEEELKRVVPVIKELREQGLSIPISVDSSKARVAAQSLAAGADWINDVTALRGDKDMVHLLASRGVPVVLMHMQGTPGNMQKNPRYDDVIQEIKMFFRDRVEFAREHGVDPEQIMVDPGIGFGKTLEHNQLILQELEEFSRLGHSVLIGHSRKSFLQGILGKGVENRLAGTLAVSTYLYSAGVDIVRVHDVEAHKDLFTTLSWLDKGTEDND